MAPKGKLLAKLAFSQVFFSLAASVEGLLQCTPSSFTFPELKGAAPIDINANQVRNFTTFSLPPGSTNGAPYTVDLCNVTVTYTHPGWDDTIHVQVWLPLGGWNGRLQALGGGGYSATFGPMYLTQAVAKGYVAIDTDAGHPSGVLTASSPADWALTSPGNVNLYLLEDYSSRSLYDMTIIGKAITENYFGTPPRFSYFSGCSGGGRQGLAIAQRYPDGYDGILAMAPAIHAENFIPAGYWAQQVMKDLDTYPSPCEIEAFTQAAIDACDGLDGVEDRIISAPSLCHFNAHSVVGRNITCNETIQQFTEAGATIVEAAWNGPQNLAGNIGWFGINKDASLTAAYITTQCSSDGTCSAAPADLLSTWFRYFIAKDPNFVAADMTTEQFFSYLQLSDREYTSVIGTAYPDLTAFRAAGGKMITWHGLADEIIPPNGTIGYYQQVLQLDPTADEFFRFYEAPGVGHCHGGAGPAADGALDQLIAWVEQGVVPETLDATGRDGTMRPLCPYPSQQTHVGGNAQNASSFICAPGPIGPDSGLLADIFPFYRPS